MQIILVGDSERKEFILTGSPFALAATALAQSQKGEIVATAETWKQISILGTGKNFTSGTNV